MEISTENVCRLCTKHGSKFGDMDLGVFFPFQKGLQRASIRAICGPELEMWNVFAQLNSTECRELGWAHEDVAA